MKRTLILHIFITLITVGETNFERDETDYDENRVQKYNNSSEFNYFDKKFLKLIFVQEMKYFQSKFSIFCPRIFVIFSKNFEQFFIFFSYYMYMYV